MSTKAPFVYIVSTGTTDKAVWRNGSASDYESGGCSFEYYLGHSFVFFPRSFLDHNPRLYTLLCLHDHSLAATMNSYPLELLAQLAPVMFVAGLNSPTSPASPPPTPTVPPMSPTSPSTPRAQDPFASLVARLRTTLSALRQVSIWQSEKARAFQVVLVDKVRRSSTRLRYEFP